MNLREQLARILPSVLSDAQHPISADIIIAKVKRQLRGAYAVSSIRNTIAQMAQDPTSVIASRVGTHGYYRRGSVNTEPAEQDPVSTVPADSGDREAFLTWAQASVAALLEVSVDEIERNQRRIKVRLPLHKRVYFRIDVVSQGDPRIEVSLKVGAKQAGDWHLPREPYPTGVEFKKWDDNNYVFHGFCWQVRADNYATWQHRVLSCTNYLVRWASTLP
jgi:hypothetical protein